ncbi:hypothetical protein N7583_07960 [Serratia marcescens]|nr:hypothetical protein [Serratia marcescens]MDT0225701.1 hypothetical protein [Serratia marcescens]
MTPREIALLTAAKMEHDGHLLTMAERREIERAVNEGVAYRSRYRQIMSSPAYQWKKPTPRR